MNAYPTPLFVYVCYERHCLLHLPSVVLFISVILSDNKKIFFKILGKKYVFKTRIFRKKSLLKGVRVKLLIPGF